CPGRRLAQALEPPAKDQYGEYNGGGWAWGHIDYAANALVVPNRPTVLSINQIRDGTSHTILVGEKPMHRRDYFTGSWDWDEPFFLGGSGGTQRGRPGPKPDDGFSIVRDSPSMGLAFRWNWGSAHPAGAEFVFADGSVRLLPFGLSPAVVKGL